MGLYAPRALDMTSRFNFAEANVTHFYGDDSGMNTNFALQMMLMCNHLG